MSDAPTTISPDLQSLADQKLIVFEGIDGTGKSTQIQLLANWLQARGHSVIQSFEPTNGRYGKILRDSAATGRLSPEDELDLFLKDRSDHVQTVIAPALERGDFVLLDRYYLSTIAYQGSRGFDIAELRQQNEAFAPRPGLILLFQIAVETSLDRIGLRDGQGNAFEKAEALQACSDIFDALPDPTIQKVNADQSREAVHSSVTTALQERLKL